MASIPDGTFPIVFESGVARFDEDGTLHVHLSHSAEAPHPLLTHPEGSEGHVPGDVAAVELVGTGTPGTVDGYWQKSDAPLPEGLVVTFRGYSSVKVEASGDLAVVVAGLAEIPHWFEPGKIHRFDGPDRSPALHADSASPPKREPPRPPPIPSPPPRPAAASEASSKSSGPGCAALALLGAVLLALAGCLAELPPEAAELPAAAADSEGPSDSRGGAAGAH